MTKSPDHPSASTAHRWDRQRIVEILLESGRRAIELRQNIQFELKPDQSLVTRADREIEAIFASEFDHPDEGSFLIGEETVRQKDDQYLDAAFRGTSYVVDPIDGTSPYYHRLTTWGISVGRMEAGVLTDGAVLLPDCRRMVVSEGEVVHLGVREEGSRSWNWRELTIPPVETGPTGLIGISQSLAKRGHLEISNPVQAVGAAVIPLVGMLDGRFLAYLGSLKLWDLAGSLPLLHRLGFSIVRLHPRGGSTVGLAVGPENYYLHDQDAYRWGIRGTLLICPPSEEQRIRKAMEV